MDPLNKPWYASRVVWVFIFTGIANFFNVKIDQTLVGTLADNVIIIITAVLALYGIYARFTAKATIKPVLVPDTGTPLNYVPPIELPAQPVSPIVVVKTAEDADDASGFVMPKQLMPTDLIKEL